MQTTEHRRCGLASERDVVSAKEKTSDAAGRKKTVGIIELFILAVGLSMDAFAVSVCKGLAMEKCTLKNATICGIWFGGFQALMPAIGYFLGYRFRTYITAYDHWIAFVLLAFIGINMIIESFSKENTTSKSFVKESVPSLTKSEGKASEAGVSSDTKALEVSDNKVPEMCGGNDNASLGVRTMFLMAVATSIDALAVGVTFAFLPDTNILAAVLFIGIITFILSMLGVKLGNIFGAGYKGKAELAGGVILVLLGLKILLDHLGIINF